VNEFNEVARTPINEWMQFLKTSSIPADTKAPGLERARECLRMDTMSKAERISYERHLDALRYQANSLDTARDEGKTEGLKEGLKKGEAIGMKKGEAIGLKKGEAIGLEKGKTEGRVEGLKEGEQLGLKKGEAIGLEKGLKEGEALGVKKIIETMRSQGYTEVQISELLTSID